MNELQNYLQQKENANENICIRCGACCGSYDGDPCQHLKKDNDGLYYCDDYHNRLGNQRTVNGTKFKCVFIKEILQTNWIGDYLCAYKKRC